MKPRIGLRGGGVQSVLARRPAWALLIILFVGLLAFGSVHRAQSSAAARADYLDSVIKCPSCNDISIAQSDIVQARELRAKVASLVAQSRSNTQIEQYVIGLYGSDEILLPSRSGLVAFVWLIPLVAIGTAIAGLTFVLVRRRRQGDAALADGDEELVEQALATSLGSR